MSGIELKEAPVAHPDVIAAKCAKAIEPWFYTDVVKDHFFNPRNIFKTQAEIDNYNPDGVGIVGSPMCGDMMKMWIKVDKKLDRIVECKWQTFGCASAIASTSILSVMVTENNGMPVEKALKLAPHDVVSHLVDLPKRKFHCSVLGTKALKAAINDYFKKSGQESRVIAEGARIIDKIMKVTDKDIEEAVIDGAVTFEDVQSRTKIGLKDKSCIPEAEQLIRFYREKYFGAK
jgi:NifU-like protein involved in Fe-S cluster formation/bacterioferritin-associated ferredoxin